MKIVAWNMAHRELAWRHLLESDYDVALLQEAAAPPPDIAARIQVDPAPWRTGGADGLRWWRTAIVRLSDRVAVDWFESKPLDEAGPGDLAVSRVGTLSAATIRPLVGEPLIVASVYGLWEKPHRSTGGGWIYADASVHRLISDLSGLVGQRTRERILAAGDLNILLGYGEHGNEYWAGRYATVFDRMSALGLPFVGPQAPSGRIAEPWPKELPPASMNVPTYHTTRQGPATATRQLDFVFASNSLSPSLRIRALNEAEQWGPSDHCRVEIEVDGL